MSDNIVKNKNMDNKDWHHMSVQEAVEALNTDLAGGLARDEITKRLKEYGPNEVSAEKDKSVLMKFLDNFKQPLIYILLVAAVVSFTIGERLDAMVICGVAFINAFIGFVQEFKAERAIAALAKSVVSENLVIREGNAEKMDSSGIVPGDIVQLSSGDRVPADMRLYEIRDLQADESALTGESVPVQKGTDPAEKDAGVGDRTSMVFAGSLITRGTAKGIVTSTGKNTETGKISRLMDENKGFETPLTRKIHAFSKTIIYFILAMAGLIFVLAFLKGIPWIESFKAAVALAVSAIPEGLPAAVTVTLAIGVNRMAKRNAIIRKLPAVEALGSTTVICSDKTGTLTQNKMSVQRINSGSAMYEVEGNDAKSGEILQDSKKVDPSDSPALRECILAGVLCNDSHLQENEGELETAGDPTEGALLFLAMKAGIDRDEEKNKHPRIDTIPFESERQYMATLNEGKGSSSGNVIYMKGSLEAVLERCNSAIGPDGGTTELNADEKKERADSMAKDGLRVLAFAKKEVGSDKKEINEEDVSSGMVFIGSTGMIDPPRTEAVEAVKAAKSAGINVKMITGDHVKTARAIAEKMGIIRDDNEKVYSGKDLADMSEDEFVSAVEESNVFARVAPEHKLRLVKALQTRGEIVAVTGDGVNDAPALQQADIGVAMGIMGTEVAKEAADMVLTDDNFSSIEAAVEEGRTVYSNLIKTIGFILPVNGGEALTILAGLLFTAVIPILPVQILWVNMVSSVALMLTLAFEPKEKDVMSRPPHSPQTKILSKGLIMRLIVVSFYNLAATFGMFKFILMTTGDIDISRTVAVNTLVAAEAFYLLSISRFIPSMVEFSRDRSVRIAYVPAIGIACLVLLQYMFTQWVPMNTLFHTSPLTLKHFVYCITAGIPVLVPALILKRYAPVQKGVKS
ncbi:MAG: HAD-IC family P-type ATPase [Candidatus Omnitrophota bacterium]